jgi:hypothetical protein
MRKGVGMGRDFLSRVNLEVFSADTNYAALGLGNKISVDTPGARPPACQNASTQD